MIRMPGFLIIVLAFLSLAAHAADSRLRIATFQADVASAGAVQEAPFYRDKSRLLVFIDAEGKERPVTNVAEWSHRRTHILANMQKVMGPLPGKEKRCPLDVKVEQETDCGSYLRQLITYASEPGGRVPAYLLTPKKALEGKEKAPAVLCLHPTDNKIGHQVVVGLGGKPNRQYAQELAERGHVVLAPSYPLLANYQPDLDKLGWQSGTMKAIWDNMRGIDLLESLPFVKPGGVGAIGHSLGGHNSVYTAVFDERIKVIVSSCGLDSYLDYQGTTDPWTAGRGWTQKRYIPKLAEYKGRLEEIPFDFHEMVAALAPRHCFISAPLGDKNFKWESVDRIVKAASQVYRLHGVPERLRVEHPDCEHDFPDEMRNAAYQLFDGVLGGQAKAKNGPAVALDGGAAETRQATGVKVGEVTDSSAIVWMRVTAAARRNDKGLVRRGRPAGPLPEGVRADDLEGACPGAAGRVRLRYSTHEDLSEAVATEWVDVVADRDFTHQFRLSGLKPSTVYYYAAETAGPGGQPVHAPLRGQFETAPLPQQHANATFTVITGQAYQDVDHPNGFNIYEAMGRLAPKFIVPTGDTVYYDSEDPMATTIELARYHWHRMYSFPRHIAFHLCVPGYWEKDDHDTLSNDCWPTLRPKFMLPLMFEDGQRIFREQVPMGDRAYRTYRWGKGLQIWLVEGRDFRSPNTAADGPDKTIWGAEQKEWLKRSLLASDADWRVLISPTPIIGPDRPKGKQDNHSNVAFQHEGDEIRRWFQANVSGSFFIACGDRHWQYHSVHPETNLHEFSSGPASDQHASGSPGEDPKYHRFHRVKGGFLSVSVSGEKDSATIAFRFHDVHGSVVYEHKESRPRKQ